MHIAIVFIGFRGCRERFDSPPPQDKTLRHTMHNCILTGLFKNRKCQGTQHRLGWCSAMILPNLSHFYNVKKMVQGVWNIFCLVQAVMEGPKWPIFWDPAPFFLPYQNGSNLVESLLSTISSFAEIPGIFDFWKDQLVNILCTYSKVNFNQIHKSGAFKT